MARNVGKTVLVDPKGTDFEPYKQASMITPNLSEFEGVAGLCRDDDDLVYRGNELRELLSLDALLITRSDIAIVPR